VKIQRRTFLKHWPTICDPSFNWNRGIEKQKNNKKKLKLQPVASSVEAMQMVVQSAHAAESIEGEELGTKVEPPVESQLAVATVAAVTLPVTNCTMSFPAPLEQVLTIFLDEGMRIVMKTGF
jgi:hypothetical protein